MTFGIRNIDDHWNLKMSHFVLGNCQKTGNSYVEFVPTKDPNYSSRGIKDDCRCYAKPNDPRCAVKIFHKYISLVPTNGPFYRHPQDTTIVDRSIRFSDQWVGKNRLRAMIKYIFSAGRMQQDLKEKSSPPTTPTSEPTTPPYQQPDYSQFVRHHPVYSTQQFPMLLHSAAYNRLATAMLMQQQAVTTAATTTAAINCNNSNNNHIQHKNHSLELALSTSPPEAQLLRMEEERNRMVEATPPVMKLNSGNMLDVSPPPSKRFRSSEDECDRDSGVASNRRSPPKVLEDIDASGGQDSEDSFIANDKLEIRVPRSIRTVTLMRGSRKLTVSLE